MRLLDRIDPRPVLSAQRMDRVNFEPAEIDASWHHDRTRVRLGSETPGQPEPNGLWETACRLLAAYEMADPSLIRAVYEARAPLRGRDMLLEGRFLFLRFYMGVRITDVIDRDHGGERTWGWAYETLEGHLERGRMSYEVVKDTGSGEVALVIEAVSEGAPTLGPVTSIGWKLFGRRAQLRFYRTCGRRLARLAAKQCGQVDPVPKRPTVEGLVLAPSDAVSGPHHRLSLRRHRPS